MHTDNTNTPPMSTSRTNKSAFQRTVELKPSTVRAYETLFERIHRKTMIYLMDSPEDVVFVTSDDLVAHWLAKQTGSSYATVCLARSALIWHFETKQPDGWQAALERIRAYLPVKADFIQEVSDTDFSVKRTRPPGRMIPEAHLHRLIDELLGYRATGHQTQWFLLAGVASGARPVEWLNAHWVDEANGVLRIYTAKVKNRNAWDKIPAMTFTAEDLDGEMDEAMANPSSANGENSWHAVDFSRRIASIDLSTEELRELNGARYLNGVKLFRDVQIEGRYRIFVRQHLNTMHATIAAKQKEQADLPKDKQMAVDEIYAKFYYMKIRHCLWRASTSAFNGEHMYSLVDTRSTFSANRKAAVGLEQAAKEMGHTGPFSARDYYAPASKAWSRFKQKHGNSATEQQGQFDVSGQGQGSGDGYGQQATVAAAAAFSPAVK